MAVDWEDMADAVLAEWRVLTVRIVDSKRAMVQAMEADHRKRRHRASYNTMHAVEAYREAEAAWERQARYVIERTGGVEPLLGDCYRVDEDGDLDRLTVRRLHGKGCTHLCVDVDMSASVREGLPPKG